MTVKNFLLLQFRSPERLLIVCGACQAACCAGMVVLGPLNRSIPVFLMLWFTAFFFYACAVWAVFKKQSPGNSSRSLRPSALFVVAGFALVFRAVVWFSPASLSDDIYRNVWDGTIVASGMNPYLHAPDDPALSNYHDADVFPLISHRQYTAIYPPVTQFVLGLAMSLHPSPGCVKAVLALFDLGCVVLLVLILSACRLPLQRCIVYAWHPLPILEFAGSGHCDSIGIFFLLLCVLFLLRGLHYAGAGALALSALAKVFPVVLVPFILARRPAAVAVCIICAVVAYAPFMDAGAHLFSSLSVYAHDWYFNGSLYDLLVLCFGDRMFARAAAALLFALCYAFAFRRYVRASGPHPQRALLSAIFMVIAALLLLSPVMYPWYLCWLLPFLAVFPNRAWLLLSALIVLSYQVLIGYTQAGLWQERLWVRLVEYVPFYVLLLYDSLRAQRASKCGVRA